MLNPRLLLQIPILFLGSCVPITQPPSVFIYNNVEAAPDVVRHEQTERLNRLMERECQAIDNSQLARFELTELPDVSKLDPDDKKALIDALFTHIEKVRDEYNRLREQFQCNLNVPRKS